MSYSEGKSANLEVIADMKKQVPEEGSGLGEYLKNVRKAQQHTLRDVEEATGVSNAYLSQLEQGKMTKPSPHILHKVATFYGVPYETLMEKAGYIAPAVEGEKRTRSGRLVASSMGNISSDEEEKLLEYLAFLRSKK